jgi:hypothetical protein
MRVFASLLVAALLAACSDDDPAPPGSGRLKLAVTDAPVDSATSVVIEFTGVEVHKASGEDFNFDFAPRQIDLLALDGTESALLLDSVELPAGRYESLRLKVNAGRDESDSFIVLDDGATHPLFIPSGNQSGLKLNRSFVVPTGGTADFTIDFDLRKSIHAPPGQDPNFIMRPTLRLVNNVEVGSARGTVAAALAGASDCAGAVYVFETADVAPDDVDGTAPEPLTSALVTLDSATGDFVYEVGFLTPGAYTFAFTCDADADDPEDDDTLVFATPQNVTITTNTVTVADF